jgi:hypothetical protein
MKLSAANIAVVAASLLALNLLCKPVAAERVDLHLVLAVDISGSIDAEEARLQHDGYVQALMHPAVLAAVHSGPLKRIAVTYIEWAGAPYQEVLADWAVIHDAESAKRFADEIARQPIDTAQWTSISAAIETGMALINQSPHRSRRRVIDISGDGANNNGPTINAVRDYAVSAGMVINGLPIINGRQSRYGMPQMPNLDRYYRECVIGGPGAFLIIANGFKDFARAIRRKMILEIAGRFPELKRRSPFKLADYHKPKGDCLDGEHWLQQHFDDY